MEKSIGIILMATLGISGIAAAALAWLCPTLLLDKTLATLAGIIGGGFAVTHYLSSRRCRHDATETVPIEVTVEDKI